MAELLAPNGKPSNLTPEQYKLVRKPEFKTWFGDWENDPANASKVVDDNGEPLPVYHSSKRKFNIFEKEKISENFEYSFGFHFSNNIEDSKKYGKITKSFFLKITNPFVFNVKDKSNGSVFIDINRYDAIHEIVKSRKTEKEIDGVIAYSSINGYVTMYSNQIKLADGTNKTFDGENSDIRFEKGGSVIINPTEIECHKCHWKWKVQDGGDDLFICHKCYTDNAKFYKFEGLEGQKILNTNIYEIGGIFQGTPHDFNKYSTEYIGTGEGNQVFGWGLYFTDLKDVARYYMSAGIDDEEAIKLDGKSLSEYNVEQEVKDQLVGITNIIFGEDKLIPTIELIKDDLILEYDEENYPEFKSVVQESTKVWNLIKDKKLSFSGNIYSVILFKGKNPKDYNLLEWEAKPTKEELDLIKNQLHKEGIIVSIDLGIGKDNRFKGEYLYKILEEQKTSYTDGTKNSNLYTELSAFLGSDKKASLFLLRAGFDGIRYKAGSLSGMEDKEGYNYVIFDGDDVTIESKEKFADGGDIQAYEDAMGISAFDEGGSVIINPTEIECHKCRWKWKVKDGGNDLFICHKCYTDNTKFYKFEGLTAEKMLENPLTIKYLKDLDDGEGWWVDKFHSKTKNYKLNTYYHLKTEGLNAGVGKGLYLGKDKNALISFYGIELENIELDTYIGNPKWLDLMEYSDFENVKKEALSKYKLSKDLTGIKLLDAIGERIKKLALEKGYDGIRYYDPNATGEEFVLFNTNKLKKNINVKHSNYKLNNGGLVGNIYTETMYFAISYTENTYDIYAQGNDLDKIRSEYNSISPSDFDNPNSDYNSKLLESRINQYEFIGDNTLNAEDYVDDLQNTDYWNLTEEDINTIEFDSVFAINKSTDEMIDEIREFIKQEYNIGGRYAEKYMTISVNDEDGEFIADLKIRTADHSQNARNNDNTSYNLSFVIANKNATEGRFIPLGTQYYYDDSADIEDIKEEIKGIIDEKIEYIKEKGKKYEDGGDIQAYEDAMGISEFDEGGETKPKKVYVSIRLPYDIEKLRKKGDSFENFNKYFYRYEDKPFQELKNGTLKGLVGVSSSPNNIAEWFVIRDCLIVMDYNRFMSMNETEAINYYDPYQLMKNNLYLFRRLYANVSRYGEQDDAVIQTLRKILEKIVPEINLEINVSKGQKYTELYRISRFLNPYQTSAFPNWIEKNQIKIENPIDLTNAILDFNKLNDSYLGSGFENPVLTFDELLPIVEKGITNASSIYDSEQEIVLINRQLNIPKNSQLFFIQSKTESNKNELIEKYNLREIYKVYFVEKKEIEKYRNIWLKKEKEKFNNKLEQGREDLELKKEQVVQELLDYFLEKSISYVKNELEKEIIEYNESLDFYDETDDDSIEQNLFSIPLVESIMNTYVLIVKNFWKAFIQKKQVENLDLYAFDMFYFNVKQELKNYFENNKDELEKLYNYRNVRGSGSLDRYRFEWLMLKTVDYYENIPELINYKELAKMYLDKMGREIYRYYDKNDLKLIPTQYKKGGETDEPTEFWGTEAGGVLVYCSITERYLILLRSEWVLEPNTWGIISGKLDDKENVQEAVLREAEEETGYKLGHLIPSFVFEKPNFKFHNFVSIVNEEFTPELNWENSDYKWVKLDEMPDNLHFGLKLLIEKEDLQKLIITNKNYSMNKYNPKDIPLLIRFSELIIEEVKSNAQLHKIIENMLKTKDNGVLSMKDYYSIIGDEITSEQEEQKMKEGGKVDYIKSNKGDIKISLAENWYSDDTDVELVPVSELIKFREFDRKEKPKYNKDNSVDNINHLKFMFQKDGVKEPLIIEYSKEDNAVLIIEGNHRINSAIDLGMEYLPARVVLKKYSKFSPSQSKNSLKVEGIKANSSNYIPSNLKPSQVGIAGTMPIYADGGIIEGRLHSECDINEGCGRKFQVGENGHIIEAERDEAVIVASAFESNEELTIKGTPSEVASALNVLGGGKNFDKGATIIKNGQELEIPELKKQAQETDVDDIIEPSSIIINRRSMADEKEYEVTGTPKQIASAINSINGNGVVIEKGAEIKEN